MPSTDSRRVWAVEVAESLALLTPQHSSALALLYGRRLAYTDIARYLGITDAEVRTAIADALRNLGEYLDRSAATSP